MQGVRIQLDALVGSSNREVEAHWLGGVRSPAGVLPALRQGNLAKEPGAKTDQYLIDRPFPLAVGVERIVVVRKSLLVEIVLEIPVNQRERLALEGALADDLVDLRVLFSEQLELPGDPFGGLARWHVVLADRMPHEGPFTVDAPILVELECALKEITQRGVRHIGQCRHRAKRLNAATIDANGIAYLHKPFTVFLLDVLGVDGRPALHVGHFERAAVTRQVINDTHDRLLAMSVGGR